MRYSQLFLSLFLLFTFASALPVPVPEDAVALEVRANSKGGSSKSSAKGQKKEAKGIDKNISIQKQESKDVKKLEKAEGTKNFDKNKTRLNNDIAKGQKQREKNQAMADKSNKELTNGLKKARHLSDIIHGVQTATITNFISRSKARKPRRRNKPRA